MTIKASKTYSQKKKSISIVVIRTMCWINFPDWRVITTSSVYPKMYNKIKCEGVIQLITNWNVLSGGLIFMLLEWHEILISFNSILITFLFRTRNRKLSFKKRREIISLDHPFNNKKKNLLQRKSFFFFNLKKNKKNCATRKRTTLGNIKNHTKNVSTMNIKSNRIFLNFLDYRYISKPQKQKGGLILFYCIC